jgi:hypothetical protein
MCLIKIKKPKAGGEGRAWALKAEDDEYEYCDGDCPLSEIQLYLI